MGLAAGILFGVATPVSKLLLGSMNGFQLAGLLYLGAALAFLPYLLRNRTRELSWMRDTKRKGAVVGIVVFGGLLGPVLLLAGLGLAASSSVSVWLNMELVATAALGVLFFKDHLDAPAAVGVLLTLAAGLVMSVKDGLGGLAPALLVTLACVSWGMDNHLTALVDGASPKTITFIKGLFAGSVNFALGFLVAGGGVPLPQLALALGVGAVSYGASIALYVASAQQLGATRAQILFSTGPFWGILVAFAVLGESVSVHAIVAMGLLALGIVFTNLVVHEHAHRHAATSHVHLHAHDDGHHDHVHADGSVPTAPHSHQHEHAETAHAHRHYPDLHHRHAHRDT